MASPRVAGGVIVLCVSCLAWTSAAASAARLPGVRSPSGNISCLLLPGRPANLVCSIAHADYASRLQARCMAPTGPGVDWHGFLLGAGRAGRVNCSGGILYPGSEHPHYVTLAYGMRRPLGAFTCTSSVTGMTCRNRTGHGVFVSREQWRTW
jgi:hypothetical protein